MPAPQQPTKGPGYSMRFKPLTIEPGIGSKSLNRKCNLDTCVHTSEEEHAVSMVMLAPFRFKEYEKRFEVMALAAEAAPAVADMSTMPLLVMHNQSSLSMPTKCP